MNSTDVPLSRRPRRHSGGLRQFSQIATEAPVETGFAGRGRYSNAMRANAGNDQYTMARR